MGISIFTTLGSGKVFELDVESWISDIGQWMDRHAWFVLWMIALGYVGSHLAAVVAMKIVTYFQDHEAERESPEQKKRITTLVVLIRIVLQIAIWLGVGLALLSHFDVNLAAFTASAGFLGLLFGFGAQDLVKNILAGLFIIAENQYRINDYIEINGVSGKVVKVSLRTTVLRDIQGNLHHVPNGTINTTSNKTIGYSMVNLDIQVDYDTDIDLLEEVINRVGTELTADPEYGHKIIEPPHFVNVTGFMDSGIKVKILGKTKPAKQWSASGQYRRRLKKAFDEEGINFAYPHMVVKSERPPTAKSRAKARRKTK